MLSFNRFKRKTRAFKELLQGAKSCYNHKISFVHLFVTNRCNSKCRICYIWNKRPKIDLDVQKIKEVVSSKVVEKNALFCLLGGEFILHPECETLLEFFSEKNKNFILFSNGILTDKLVELVKEFKVPKLMLSLDGPKETYKKVRGIDGYDDVIRTIKELKDSTEITLTYVINPFNSRKDFLHVKNVAEKNKIGLVIGTYDTRGIYDTKLSQTKFYSIGDLFKSNYLKSYELWSKGLLNIPCWSIRTLTTIMENGDVLLCQQKDIVLGNIYKESLEDIWIRSRELQKSFVNCNGCWISCHRSFDNNLCKLINTFTPHFVSSRVFGKYNWDRIGKII